MAICKQKSTQFRGINHLALNTADMKRTIDFYVQVLGMPLIHVLRTPKGMAKPPGNRGNPPYDEIPHYFFDAGNDTVVAFFEIPDAAGGIAERNAIAAMQHCSFTVSAEGFEDLRARLEAQGVSYLGPINPYEGRRDIKSIYFFDNNGIRLEATVHLAPGAVSCVEDIRQTKEQARSEIASIHPDPEWVERCLVAFKDS